MSCVVNDADRRNVECPFYGTLLLVYGGNRMPIASTVVNTNRCGLAISVDDPCVRSIAGEPLRWSDCPRNPSPAPAPDPIATAVTALVKWEPAWPAF